MTTAPPPIDDDARLARAEEAYQRQDWSAALPVFADLFARDAARAQQLGLPLAIAHCRIELEDDIDLASLAQAYGTPVQSEAENARIIVVRVRAAQLCREHTYDRAASLLRLLTRYVWSLAETYSSCLFTGQPLGAGATAAHDDDPPFLAESALDAAGIAAIKARFHGKRLLSVMRRFYFNVPGRQNEIGDSLPRTAARFGLTVRDLNSHGTPAGTTEALFPALLHEAIASFAPDVIFYDDLFQSGVSAASPALADQVATVLELARARGARVVKYFPDAWLAPPDQVYRGLGSAIDMVVHMHPTILPRATPNERAATFCNPLPHDPPAATGSAGVLPRAVSMGAITWASVPRLFWWAEIGRLGLPFDFLVTDPGSPNQLTDTDYANLMRRYQLVVNFTNRASGVRIITGRTIEAMLAGGVLVEEDSIDTRHFFKPGVHYVPFRTHADLAALIPALLADAPYRARLAAAGRHWAETYFTGEHFWAGLLSRLERRG